MTDHEVATTILKQLGAHKFAAMTGARNFTSCNQALTFHLPRNRYFRITLASNDTYKLEYMKLPHDSLNLHVTATSIGVYAEQLQSTFTRMTGLETYL